MLGNVPIFLSGDVARGSHSVAEGPDRPACFFSALAVRDSRRGPVDENQLLEPSRMTTLDVPAKRDTLCFAIVDRALFVRQWIDRAPLAVNGKSLSGLAMRWWERWAIAERQRAMAPARGGRKTLVLRDRRTNAWRLV